MYQSEVCEEQTAGKVAGRTKEEEKREKKIVSVKIE